MRPKVRVRPETLILRRLLREARAAWAATQGPDYSAETYKRVAGWIEQTFGIPTYRITTQSVQVQWDGEVFRAYQADGLLHEVAHYVVAPDERRFTWGFGLGSEPESFGAPPELQRTCRKDKAAREEGIASLWGILLERELGLPWWENLLEHEWVWVEDGVFEWEQDCIHRRMRTLYDRGLVDLDANPQIPETFRV